MKKTLAAIAALLALTACGPTDDTTRAAQAPTPATEHSAPPPASGPAPSGPEQQPEPLEEPEPDVDCSDPSLTQEEWMEHCSDAEPDMSDVEGWYEPSLDKKWQLVTPQNCRIQIEPITDPYTDALTTRIAEYIGSTDFYTLKAKVNFRHPAEGTDREESCGIEFSRLVLDDGSVIEPVGIDGLVMDTMESDDSKYDEGFDLMNLFIDSDKYGSARVNAKSTDYAFFQEVKPYNQIEIEPHGIETQYAEQVQ